MQEQEQQSPHPGPYPLIDIDPHAGRVVRYFRSSDYALWAATTVAVPGALRLWEYADPAKITRRTYEVPQGWKPSPGLLVARGSVSEVLARQMATGSKIGAFIGFCAGFMLAYQRSSMRFWGWTENQREIEKDYAELSQLAKEGKPLYGVSHQPDWVQATAHRNSVHSQLKFSAFPMVNLVNHPYHTTDKAKYGVQTEAAKEE